jgi:hypothetical protein
MFGAFRAKPRLFKKAGFCSFKTRALAALLLLLVFAFNAFAQSDDKDLPAISALSLIEKTKPVTGEASASLASILIVDDNSACPGASFTTIQAAINAAAPGDTIQVCDGIYAEQLNINKALTLLGPNANIDPNTGVRVAEAVIIPTASDPLNPAFAGPISVLFAANGVTFKGFTVDGNNPGLTSGVVFNGADVDAEFGIYGTETANPDAVVVNNIVKNIGEISIWINSNGQGGAKNANSLISANKVDNNLGNFGQGIRISDDAWLDVTNNVVTRVRSGIVIENYSGNTTTHPASVINGNNLSSFRLGIRHNLHYVYGGPGFTISQNTVAPYVPAVLPPQVTAATSYQGIRVESIQQTVFVTVQDNILAGNKTALTAGGYTRDEGLMLTNASNTSPNIVFRRNSSTDFIRGVFNETPAVPLFESNTITNNTTGVYLSTDAPNGLTASFNRIAGNGTGMRNDGAGSVIAENNWWGCNFGPGAPGAGCSGSANSAIGTIDANPWLTLTTSASPSSILVGANSNITSKLTINSNAADTSGPGNVPNGTPANFAGTLGTVAPPASVTTAGVTGTVFTATNGGIGGAATTVDGQTVNAAVTNTFTCNNVSIPATTTLRNNVVSVPINVDSTTGRDVISYDFTVTYNPAVMLYLGTDQTATLSSGMTITVNSTAPGTLIVSGFTANPLVGAGTLLKLNFFANGAIGSVSPANFTGFIFNEGIPCTNSANGSVSIVSGTITGIVNYANSITFKPVPNTVLSATGSIPVSTNSAFTTGAYSLSGLGGGAYTVTPTKTTDVTSITGFDSGLIAQHVVNLITLTSAQAAAADVSEAAGITSFDAALIARFVVALPGSGVTGTWKFNPVSRPYADVEANHPNQDYSAILMGEVSGDWTPPTMFAKASRPAPEAIVTVTAPTMNAQVGTNFDIPVTVSDTTGQGIISYQFDLLYDPAIIQPQGSPVDTSGTMSSGMSVTVNNPSPGLLKVVCFQANPIAGAGTLFKFKFTAIGAAPSFSLLTWQNFMFNEGNPDDNAINGRVNIVPPPTAASVNISGRILTPQGQPIANATVILTGPQGEFYLARSGPLGYYTILDVPAGASYVLTAKAKQHSFPASLVNLFDPVDDLDLIANE